MPVVVVAPHVGLLDAVYFMYAGRPRPIALEPYAKLPIIGALFKRQHGIAVPLPKADMSRAGAKAATDPTLSGVSTQPAALPPAREDAAPPTAAAGKKPSSAATAAVRAAIQEHKTAWRASPAASGKPILILPEGSTHNGASMLKFFSGAFEGGGPVQPVLLSYPHTLGDNNGFFATTLPAHGLRLLCAPWQRVRVTYLPVYHPSEEEEANAELYAERVRVLMAKEAGLALSEYGARDLRKELKERALLGKSIEDGHRE